MTKQDFDFCYRRMCSYFRCDPDKAQEKEFYAGKFELWTVEEWNATWNALAETQLSRMPGYGDFASLRRLLHQQSNWKPRNTVPMCADCSGTGWAFNDAGEVFRCQHLRMKQVEVDPDVNREGLKRFQMAIIDLHDRTVSGFIKDGPKPLFQILAEGSVAMMEGITHSKVNEDEANRNYLANQERYK